MPASSQQRHRRSCSETVNRVPSVFMLSRSYSFCPAHLLRSEWDAFPASTATVYAWFIHLRFGKSTFSFPHFLPRFLSGTLSILQDSCHFCKVFHRVFHNPRKCQCVWACRASLGCACGSGYSRWSHPTAAAGCDHFCVLSVFWYRFDFRFQCFRLLGEGS